MRHALLEIADGWKGTEQTVAQVVRLVDEALLDPTVVQTARNIVRNVEERDLDGEIRAISRFVRRHVRYVREAVETLSAPADMLQEIRAYGKTSGDCDEFTTLWAALLRALGHEIRFKVVSTRKDKVACHIWGQVKSPTRGWIDDDTINKREPMGWRLPKRVVTLERTYGADGLPQFADAKVVGRQGRRWIVRKANGELGWVSIVAAAVSAAATISAAAMQKKAQDKALKAQKSAQKEVARQFEKQMSESEAARGDAIEIAKINATSGSGSTFSGIPKWVPVAAVGVAVIGLAFWLGGR